MAKRKKYPKLPNGYGSIKYLGKGRRNPYGVYPSVKDYTDDGVPITPKALCYTDAWMKGFTVLTAYRAGTYYPGFELTLNLEDTTENVESLARKILADYSQTRLVSDKTKHQRKTFSDVYTEFFSWKFEKNQKRKYSSNTIYATKTAYKHFSNLHNRNFCELNVNELQSEIDSCQLSHALLEHMVNLLKQMYKYAMMEEIVEKNQAAFVQINIPDDDKPGIPFSDSELQVLWKNQNNPIVEFILIMCYSGYRINAYPSIEINMKEQYFKGGIKTASSKNRIVPIHSSIFPLIEKRLKRDKKLLTCSTVNFRISMYDTLSELHLQKHTPHDCRHTFSMLCEKYQVNENDRKRMMGHSFGTDITNGTYGHRSLEDLRTEIEKIKVCY